MTTSRRPDHAPDAGTGGLNRRQLTVGRSPGAGQPAAAEPVWVRPPPARFPRRRIGFGRPRPGIDRAEVTLMRDEVEALQRLRRAARAHAAAVADMAEFVERSSAVLDPAQLAEYEALLAREESTRAERQDLFHELGVHTVDGGPTLNPSTYDLLAAIHEVPAEEVIVLANSTNVIMAAEHAARLSDKRNRKRDTKCSLRH